MADPELDQAIGRLAAGRLRAAVSGPFHDGPSRAGTARGACPEAELWAAYVDGGLAPAEVDRLDAHLAGCPACRRIIVALTPDLVALAESAADAPPEVRGVVLPFRPRLTWAWMSIAAALLAGVTVWSFARFDRPAQPVATMADGREAAAAAGAKAEPPAPAAAPVQPADTISEVTAAPLSAPGSRPPAAALMDAIREKAAMPAERDRDFAGGKGGDTDKARVDRAQAAAGLVRTEPTDAAAAKLDVTPVPARPIALQTNAVQPATARPHGPLTNQQANAQGANQAPSPALASAAAPPPPAFADAQKRDRQAAAAAATEVITQAASPAMAPPAAPPAPAPVPAGARLEAVRKVTAEPEARAFGYGVGGAAAGAFTATFAEPEGRLRWRISGARLESSSDGGTTWNHSYTATSGRLRAGSAPSIDTAWAVGEHGLVVRRALPGAWTPVEMPAEATLVAISATSAAVARVTTEDGRVFLTTDGGRSWAPVSPPPE